MKFLPERKSAHAMAMSIRFERIQKHNYWAAAPADTGVPRRNYLEKLTGLSGNRLIKVLVGQRRTGKSTILKQFIRHLIDGGVHPHNIFYLNKEHLDFADITDWRDLDDAIQEYLKRLDISGKVYLLLDEIQEVDGWEKLAASYSQDSQREVELVITGSNSHMLSSELGTYLSGRYVPIAVYPFSFSEFVEAYGLQPDKVGLLEYLRRGGLPELMNLQTEEARRHYTAALRDSIILNDIVKKFGVQDVALLERLFHFLCAHIGSLFSVNKLVNHLNSAGTKTNVETLSRYVDHLERALLIHACNRFDIRGKDILSGARKYYVNDLAFREYLASGFDPGLSRRLENCMYLHFKALGYQVHVGQSRNFEIDFVLERADERIYAQICYLLAEESIIEREYRGLESIRDNYPKMVISMDDVHFGTRNGIQHRLAWKVFNESEQ